MSQTNKKWQRYRRCQPNMNKMGSKLKLMRIRCKSEKDGTKNVAVVIKMLTRTQTDIDRQTDIHRDIRSCDFYRAMRLLERIVTLLL